jgi:SAM-dependent methyltransferase
VFPLLTEARPRAQAGRMTPLSDQPCSGSLVRSNAPTTFAAHPVRGRFNALFFTVMGGYLNWHMGRHKARVFADLPTHLVELGSGVGANMRFLPRGARLIAVEPNPHMHSRLRRSARAKGVALEIRDVVAERIDLPDDSTDAVISSLVLCSVSDPAQVLAEIRRVLRPGGRFSFAEHVAAKRATPTSWAQRLLRRPWAWTFEGCSCERDLESLIRAAGFASVDVERYRIHSPFLPFNTHIAGTAVA